MLHHKDRIKGAHASDSSPHQSSSLNQLFTDGGSGEALCWFSWWFYDAVSIAYFYAKNIFYGFITLFCEGGPTSQFFLCVSVFHPLIECPFYVLQFLYLKGYHWGIYLKFQKCFSCTATKEKKLWLCLKGISTWGACCHATHVHEQQWPFPQHCRMLMRWLNEGTLTSSALQVLSFSGCECIPAFYSCKTLKKIWKEIECAKNMVSHRKVAKWLWGLPLSLVVWTVLKCCSHPFERTYVLLEYLLKNLDTRYKLEHLKLDISIFTNSLVSLLRFITNLQVLNPGKAQQPFLL